MKIHPSLIALTLLAAPFLKGQGQPGDPRFEVVSVKPATTPASDSVLHVAPGRVHCTCLLSQMIQNAYAIRFARIVGPGWLLDPSTSRSGPVLYFLDARFGETSPETDVPAMMRRMLAERFHLTAHLESRTEPVYLLQVAPHGLKLKPAPPDPPEDASAAPVVKRLIGLDLTTGEVHVHGVMTLSKLALFLSNEMDREVVDRTGQDAEFDIVMDAHIPTLRPLLPGSLLPRPDLNAPSGETASIFEEIQKLGLQLVNGRAPIDHLVIDTVDRVPTPN